MQYIIVQLIFEEIVYNLRYAFVLPTLKNLYWFFGTSNTISWKTSTCSEFCRWCN